MVAQRVASNNSTHATAGSDNAPFRKDPNPRALRLAPAFLPKLGRFSCSLRHGRSVPVFGRGVVRDGFATGRPAVGSIPMATKRDRVGNIGKGVRVFRSEGKEGGAPLDP